MAGDSQLGVGVAEKLPLLLELLLQIVDSLGLLQIGLLQCSLRADDLIVIQRPVAPRSREQQVRTRRPDGIGV